MLTNRLCMQGQRGNTTRNNNRSAFNRTTRGIESKQDTCQLPLSSTDRHQPLIARTTAPPPLQQRYLHDGGGRGSG